MAPRRMRLHGLGDAPGEAYSNVERMREFVKEKLDAAQAADAQENEGADSASAVETNEKGGGKEGDEEEGGEAGEADGDEEEGEEYEGEELSLEDEEETQGEDSTDWSRSDVQGEGHGVRGDWPVSRRKLVVQVPGQGVCKNNRTYRGGSERNPGQLVSWTLGP